MANPTFKRIKDLSLEKTSVADNDWFVLEDSEDSFKTKKVKGQYIGANIYKNDGTLTGNRTVTMSGNSLTFSGGTVKTISPSASALDVAFGVRNNTDTSNLFVVNGAGRIGINGSPLAFSRLYITAPNGEYAGFFESTDETAMYASASSGRAIYAISTTGKGIEAISTGSYGGQFKSRDNYAVWSQSTGVGSQLSILSNGQCDFKNYADTLTVLQLLNDGKIGMPNIPTSASGLSTGQIWNNGGVLNIV